MKVLIASRNLGKVNEFRELLAGLDIEVLSAEDVGLAESFDPEETGSTFEENSLLKAKAYAKKTGLSVIADDSGLVVDALDGRPGVYSKRYGNSDSERNEKLLQEMDSIAKTSRNARFVCSMTIFDPVKNVNKTVEGKVEGLISNEAKGKLGFGYDPIFIPEEGDGRTFAEYGSEFKNKVSHRARALEALKKEIVDLKLVSDKT